MPSPAHIHGFEILERIGSGAESAIYRAREPPSRRTVALKHVVIYTGRTRSTFATPETNTKCFAACRRTRTAAAAGHRAGL